MTVRSCAPLPEAAKPPPAGRIAVLREFVLYFGASVLALALDMALLLVLAAVVHYLIAATVGFVSGALLAYLLSTRIVFGRRQLAHDSRRELLMFVGIGIVGLGLNNGLIFVAVEWFAAPLVAAKIVAASVTFLSNFGLRKLLLF